MTDYDGVCYNYWYILALTMVYDRANSCITTEIVAPPWLHKYIIGKGGANISRITKDLPKVNPISKRSHEDQVLSLFQP